MEWLPEPMLSSETGTLAALSRLWAPGRVERVTVGAPGVSDVSVSQPPGYSPRVAIMSSVKFP